VSSSVKLSLKAARFVLELVDGSLGIYGPAHEQAEMDLKEAIAKATRASATRRRMAAPKREKRKTKRDETATIRAVVVDRARGRCEACSFLPLLGLLEMDHFFGRGRTAQSVANCWLLCRMCHRAKTDNRPDAAFWLRRFIWHCHNHGYSDESFRAVALLSKHEAKATLAEVKP
jgi:5-methylcytosine-specific restriction endonuclease McrA